MIHVYKSQMKGRPQGFPLLLFKVQLFLRQKEDLQNFGYSGPYHIAVDIILFFGSMVVGSTSTQKPAAELVIEGVTLTSGTLSFCLLPQFHLRLEGGTPFPKALRKVQTGRKLPNQYYSLTFVFHHSPVELSVAVYLCNQALEG